MTWMLAVATLGVLGAIAVAVHRAAADAAERLCDCRCRREAGEAGAPGRPPGGCPPGGGTRRHLRVVA